MRNQAERMEVAKQQTLSLLNLENFDQCGDWCFAALQEVDGQEHWVTVTLKARKNFDIDEEIENWEFQKKERENKALEKERKKQEKNKKS